MFGKEEECYRSFFVNKSKVHIQHQALDIVEAAGRRMQIVTATGVAFTRNPSTGTKELFGEYLDIAQGEDVVAGIRTPKSISSLEESNKDLYSELVKISKILNEVNVNALRAGEKTPVAFTNISKSEIEKGNLGQALPYIIALTPSVVPTPDAGAGIGYTGFRIRVPAPPRIHVQVNGITLNAS